MDLFFDCAGSSVPLGLFSSCSERELLALSWGTWASHCSDSFCCWARALGPAGLSSSQAPENRLILNILTKLLCLLLFIKQSWVFTMFPYFNKRPELIALFFFYKILIGSQISLSAAMEVPGRERGSNNAQKRWQHWWQQQRLVKVMPMPCRETSTTDKLNLPPVFKQSILGNRHPCGKLNLEVKEGRVHVITGPIHGYIESSHLEYAYIYVVEYFVVVVIQLLSHVWLFVTPRTAAH